MNMLKCLLTNNGCYKEAKRMTPVGIIIHSTGCNNPNLRRYVQPDDGIIGYNIYQNDWNHPETDVCVHGFVGKTQKGDVRFVQTLPWNFQCWGCSSGWRGSYNRGYIQIEVCEDDLTDEKYFDKAFAVAVEVTRYLVKQYNISINNVISHKEAHDRGYASDHVDCNHWLAKFGKDMDWFRQQVKKGLTTTTTKKPTTSATNKTTTTTSSFKSYRVKVTDPALNIRAGAGTNYKVNGMITDMGVYTIIAEKSGTGAKKWGRLKSKAGWIALDYTRKI